MLLYVGGGHSKLRYALIGLPPYAFHYDLSQKLLYSALCLPYFIALNDLHKFNVPADIYKNFFREEWLNTKLPTEKFNIPQGNNLKGVMSGSNSTNAGLQSWAGKYYPETRDENVKILDDYLTLCETNNIRPVIFAVPATERWKETFNKQLFEEFFVLIEQTLNKHPDARFFDGWKLKTLTYADFHDHQHLNIHGAAKFSTYLNDFIEGLEFNYYKDINNFHNRLNDSIEELNFRNYF